MSEFRLNRVLSKPLTTILLGTPLTPNQITTLSLCLGLGAGFLFSLGRYWPALAAATLYQMAAILDNCDGEVARAKNMKSRFGGWYDVVSDLITDLFLFGGVTLGALRSHAEGPVVLFGVLALSGVVIHGTLVIWEKIRGFGPAVFDAPHPEHNKRRSPLLGFFDAIREGDSSWCVLLFAMAGQMTLFLRLGGLYMQLLWIASVIVNYRWLFVKKNNPGRGIPPTGSVL